MNLLRQLRKTYTITSVGNFRPVQPLYDRLVRASFQAAEMTNPTSTKTDTPITSNGADTTTPTITDQNGTSSISSTGVATTNAEESPPAPTVEFDLESSAVGMTTSLFLSMLFASLSALIVN